MSRPAKAELPAERIWAAFEQAAAAASDRMSRDPEVLAFGAGLLRAQLLWARGAQAAMASAFAPLEVFTQNPFTAFADAAAPRR